VLSPPVARKLQVLTAEDHARIARTLVVQPSSLAERAGIVQAHRPGAVTHASVALGSRRLASFRRGLLRGSWFVPGLCCGLSRFGRDFGQSQQLPLGLFGSAMMAMVQ